MAKRQDFQFGSTTSNIQTMTVAELNNGWEQLAILYSKVLNGTFAAISKYSYDSSQEIANAIKAITGAEPTGTSVDELANALQQMRQEIETSSLTFKGYVATSAPSASSYSLKTGNIWINSATMPTTFPVATSSIKVWNGTSWENATDTYTAVDFDTFRNINDGEGYYWFGGEWVVMSTDMDTNYFELNSAGKWTIKNIVTTDTNQTIGGNKTFSGTIKAPNPASSSNDTTVATTKWVKDNTAGVDNVVKTTGNQEIGGIKTITDQLRFQNGANTNNKASIYKMVDTGSLLIGIQNTDNTGLVDYITLNTNGNIALNPNGYVKSKATSDIGSVVTTEGISKSSDGYVKLGNGIILQWGSTSAIGSSTTVTLPTAFSSAFRVVALSTAPGGDLRALGVQYVSSTQFALYANGGAASYGAWWIAIGY